MNKSSSVKNNSKPVKNISTKNNSKNTNEDNATRFAKIESKLKSIPLESLFDIIPFDSMPNNIEELLTNTEYLAAMYHPMGPFAGFVRVIHENPTRPEWGNIDIPNWDDDMPNEEKYALVYMGKEKNKWEKRNMCDEILGKLFDEYASCLHYFVVNKYRIMGLEKPT